MTTMQAQQSLSKIPPIHNSKVAILLLDMRLISGSLPHAMLNCYSLMDYDLFSVFIFTGDILLQIDKREFLTSGDVNYYMKWLPTGEIYNIYVSNKFYISVWKQLTLFCLGRTKIKMTMKSQLLVVALNFYIMAQCFPFWVVFLPTDLLLQVVA